MIILKHIKDVIFRNKYKENEEVISNLINKNEDNISYNTIINTWGDSYIVLNMIKDDISIEINIITGYEKVSHFNNIIFYVPVSQKFLNKLLKKNYRC